MKLPDGELIVASRLEKYPPPPATENASLIRWRSFSPFWWGIVQGLIEGLLQPILWKDGLTDRTVNEITKHFLEEDCGGDSSDGDCGCADNKEFSQVGALGLTITELESLLMSTIMGIRWKDGKLEVQYFPCCDWVPVGVNSGLAPAPIQKPDTGWTLDSWEGAGKPPDVPLPIPLPPTEGHITPDSIACAKASGILTAYADYLDDIAELIAEFGAVGAIAFASLVAIAVVAFPVASWPTAAAIVALILPYIYAGTWGDMADEISAKADEIREELAGLVCFTVENGLVSSGTQVTTEDMVNAIKTAQGTVAGASIELIKVMNALPLSLWSIEAQEAATVTPCACDDYKPYNYTPPSAAGQFTYVGMVGAGGSMGAPAAPVGTEFGAVNVFTPIGTRVGATGFATQYRGQTGTSPITYYSAFGVLMTVPSGVVIQEIKLDVSVFNPGTGGTKRLLWRGFHPVDGWVSDDTGLVTDGDNNSQIVNHAGLSGAEYTHLYVFFQVTGVSSPSVYATVPKILISGTINGVGFLDKTIGENLV